MSVPITRQVGILKNLLRKAVQGGYVKEGKKMKRLSPEALGASNLYGAEAGTRTQMSIRSLRPEGGCPFSQVVVMLRFQ